jgi:hypothetical protein
MFQLGISSRFWIQFVLYAIFTVSLGVASSAVASDVRFTSGRSALKIPFKFHNNHIYVRVSVNGSAPLWFVLDTGAPNIIALKHAQALGMKLMPGVRSTGSGEKEIETFLAQGNSLALPGLSVSRQRIVVLPMENLEECSNEIDVDLQGYITRRTQSGTDDQRQPFEGVLGEDFLRQFVVEIDYAAQLINLYDPQGYKYSGQGEAIPLEVRRQHIFLRAPFISAQSGTLTGLFLIYTGFMGALILNTPYVEKHRLLPPAEQTKPYEVCGIGGGAKTKMGKVESLRLGSAEVKAPITLFSQASVGNMSREDFDGMIGNAVLRRFSVVVFDYSRNRMIVESSKR